MSHPMAPPPTDPTPALEESAEALRAALRTVAVELDAHLARRAALQVHLLSWTGGHRDRFARAAAVPLVTLRTASDLPGRVRRPR